MKRKWIVLAPLAVVGLLLFVALGGAIVRLLWNWLLPQLFGWREITFWQALGLLALCRILFGGFGSHGGSRSGSRMTPEERARFRQRIRERFGFHSPADATGSGSQGQ
jgi:uncharacterized membrane protein